MTKQEGFTSRYEIPEYQWLNKCRDKYCDEPKIKCYCKHYGHYVIHKGKGDNKVASVYIMHSHFLENIMIGRNKFCWQYDINITDEDIEWKWSIKPEVIYKILKEMKLPK